MVGKHPERKRLPDTRPSITHKVEIDGQHDLYITAGFYPDTHLLGEIFLTMGKTGSTLRGMLDWIGTDISLLLQYGADPHDICAKYIGMNFEPKGKTSNPDIPECSSIPDYLSRWLKDRFLDNEKPFTLIELPKAA